MRIKSLRFPRAGQKFIFDAIKAQANMIALTTRRHLAERDARISALLTAVEERDRQIVRHSEHLQRLQARVESLERFKADKK